MAEPLIEEVGWPTTQELLRGNRGATNLAIAELILRAQGFEQFAVRKDRAGYRAALTAARYTTDTPPRYEALPARPATEEPGDDAADEGTESQ